MTELKTLKDIKIEGSNGRLRLKAEAMKWLKGFNWTNDDLINETEFAFKEKKTDWAASFSTSIRI